MSKTSKLLKVLTAAEEFLLAFDNYFSRHPWVAETAGYSGKEFANGSRTLINKGFLNEDFSPTESVNSTLSLINLDWDRNWRFVIYDIPERHRKFRQLIRRKLFQLGFRKLQRSVWVSPLPVDPFIKAFSKEHNFDSFTFLIGKMPDQNPKKLVAELWQTDQWKKEAGAILRQIKKSRELSLEIKHRFWDLILDHPRVPIDLLPYNWPLKKTISEFSRKNRGNKQVTF